VGVVEGSSHSLSRSKIRKAVGGSRGRPFFDENNRRRGRILVDSIANDAAYLALASLTAQRGGRGKMEVGGGWSRNSRGRPEEKRAAGE
jgi:hypothetical protein